MLIETLNNGLEHINLNGLDYILRVDGDAVLPKNFVEGIKSKADGHGSGGCGFATLIRVSDFIKAMEGNLVTLMIPI